MKNNFNRLALILKQYQTFWHPRSFHYLTLPWEKDYPKLSYFLRNYQGNLDYKTLNNYLPNVDQLSQLIAIKKLNKKNIVFNRI